MKKITATNLLTNEKILDKVACQSFDWVGNVYTITTLDQKRYYLSVVSTNIEIITETE